MEHFAAWCAELELDNGGPWLLEPFQLRFVEDVFSGVPVSWLVIPEGNGKTTLIAGLALYHIEFNPSAYVAVAASSRDQAEWIYRQAEGLVVRNELEDMTRSTAEKCRVPHRFRCLEGYRRIRHDASNGRIQVFAADDRSGDGAIASLYILDELHRHRGLSLYRTWSGKVDKRGGQLIAISTAGEVGGEFERERERFRQSAEDVIRDGSFVRAAREDAVLHEWAINETDDPEDLAAVKAANPFSGITEDWLRRKRELPAMTASHWARFTANRPSRSDSAAIPERMWHDAATAEQIPRDETVWLGMDFGWQWDTTAFVPLWWKDAETRILGPAVILEPPRDGSSTDPNLVKRAVNDLCARYRVSTVVMDPDRAHDIAAWMSDELNLIVVERAQSAKPQGEDYERFMEGLRQGWLRHSGDEGLRQHALNAIARLLPDGGAKFARPSEVRKGGNQDMRVIDALVAAAMVHSYAVEMNGNTPWVGWGPEEEAA